MDISAIMVFDFVFIFEFFSILFWLKKSKIKKMVKKLQPKTKEETIVNICKTLQNFAENSFH
jgi:hypothetical protein